MTELGVANHELAAKVGTSRQAIYKLRNGITRMLPDWAKRIAPHLGVSWQELVDGTPSDADLPRAELLAAYDAMSEEQRQALLVIARGMAPPTSPPEAQTILSRLVGRLGLDDLSIDVWEAQQGDDIRDRRRARATKLNEEATAAIRAALVDLLGLPKAPRAPPRLQEPSPPRPRLGGNVRKGDETDCDQVVRPLRVPG
jgi:DNA-binding XRE family transcriptional regulator